MPVETLDKAGWQWTNRHGWVDDLHCQQPHITMSSLWNSLLAQADADDRAALASAVAAGLRQQLEANNGTDAGVMLPPAEVALRCGVHVETVRRAIRSGQLPAVKIGSRLRVNRDDLARWGDRSNDPGLVLATPLRRRLSRRQAGVMTQAVDGLNNRGMEKAS